MMASWRSESAQRKAAHLVRSGMIGRVAIAAEIVEDDVLTAAVVMDVVRDAAAGVVDADVVHAVAAVEIAAAGNTYHRARRQRVRG